MHLALNERNICYKYYMIDLTFNIPFPEQTYPNGRKWLRKPRKKARERRCCLKKLSQKKKVLTKGQREAFQMELMTKEDNAFVMH